MGRNEQWHVDLEQAIVDDEPCVLWSKGPDSFKITHLAVNKSSHINTKLQNARSLQVNHTIP